MIRPILLAALAALMLAACAPTGDQSSAARNPSSQLPLQQPAGETKRIAITRGFTLRLPSNEVAAVQKRHLDECSRLECTVLDTRLEQLNDGRTSARISVRVAPDRYSAFAAAVTAPPSEVAVQTERAEDKTVAVLDADKRLEVKTALRDRLTTMLRDSGNKSAADLATIEKELAQVQGDIEAAVAQREYLRTITETVRVDIAYDGRRVVIAGYDFSPIKQSTDGIIQTLIASVGWLIWFIAALVPWLPVIVLAMWGTRWGLRRWRARRAT